MAIKRQLQKQWEAVNKDLAELAELKSPKVESLMFRDLAKREAELLDKRDRIRFDVYSERHKAGKAKESIYWAAAMVRVYTFPAIVLVLGLMSIYKWEDTRVIQALAIVGLLWLTKLAWQVSAKREEEERKTAVLKEAWCKGQKRSDSDANNLHLDRFT